MGYNAEKDLHPFVGTDQDTDIILFFTDGKSEPKKINVRRCIENDFAFSGNAQQYTGEDLKDFITACPKTPSDAIHFSWSKNLQFDSNFEKTNGFQFAYQNVYVDGFVTAISPLSEVAFPPSIQSLGSSSLSNVTIESECILEIPAQGPEISSIRILFREGNDGAFNLMDEISNQEDIANPLFDFEGSGDVLGYYTFRNDSVYPIVPLSQTSKNFDNLPRKAKAQSVTGNRLMYGNYTEGFDPVQVSAVGEAVLSSVDQNAALADIGSSIKSINVFTDNQRNGGAPGTSLGFVVDYGEEDIKTGTYRLSIDLAPEQNFHLFNSKAYKPSKNVYLSGENQFVDDDLTAFDILDGNEPATVFGIREGGDPIPMLYGYDEGRAGVFEVSGTSVDGTAFSAEIGSTPANPLIIPTAPISVDIVVEVTNESGLSPSVFATAMENIISGGDPLNPYVSVVSYSGQDLSGLSQQPFNEYGTSGVRCVVSSDTTQLSGSAFPANSAKADQVCFIPYNQNVDVPGAIKGAPAGFFIVRESNMLLNVLPVQTTSNSGTDPLFIDGAEGNPQTTTVRHYRFDVVDVVDMDIMPCIPEPTEGLGFTYKEGEAFTSDPVMPWQSTTLAEDQELSGQLSNVSFIWPMVLGSSESTASLGNANSFSQSDISQFEAFGKMKMNGGVFGDAIPSNYGESFRFKTLYEGNEYVFTADLVEVDPATVVPTITIDYSTLTWESAIPEGFAGGSVQNPFPNFSEGSVTWTWLLADYVPDAFGVNPNFPKGPAVFNRDGTQLTFNHTYNPGKICPIAINRWFAFDQEDIENGEWVNSFEYSWLNNESQSVSVKPSTTVGWFEPMSDTWAYTINSSQFKPTAEFSTIYGQEPGTTFVSFIDGAAGVGSLIDSGEDGYSKISEDEFYRSRSNGDQVTTFLDEASEEIFTGEIRPVSNRRGTVWNTTLIGIHENFKYLRSDASTTESSADAYLNPSSPTDAEIESAAAQDLGSFFDVGIEGSAISSFKTRDFHDFGIVYFDDRGRAGTVNSLPSVYVPGYSSSERAADEKGSVIVKYTINHLPPDWASSYKIVYAGAANTERFIQYVAGGAFVEPQVIGSANDKIYVSLNYLQGNRASYAKSYGAVDQDTGEPTLYRFTPGDKLRVISHFENEDTIVYAPKTYEFDVVGVEEISLQTGTDSPLVSETDGLSEAELFSRYGAFVVLRNNLQASGFTASDVSGGESSHNWGKRCVFEIVSPKKSRDEELKPFYETPYGGKIILENGIRVHQYGTINIDQGDVTFRQVPLNMRPFDESTETFTDIIGADEGTGSVDETSQSRFRSYFLESQSITDLFRSNAKSFGKVHFAIDGYRERINDSSIIYSDATNQESFNLFYTSFSPLAKNYFDMPAKYGDIDYLADSGDTLIVAQNSKIGKVSVDKSLTSTAAGSDTLNLSDKVLNSARFYLEDVGTDGHPESVTWQNSTLYFVDKSRGVVVEAGENGMKFISSNSMDKFFKRLFKEYDSTCRVSTGYNPFSEEVIVSVMTQDQVNSVAPYVEMSSDLYSHRTFAYDLGSKVWTTAYSFHSSEYSNVGNSLISFKNIVQGKTSPAIVWRHDDGVKNNFYDQPYPSSFVSVAVSDANLTKDYKSVSIDGTDPWEIAMSTSKENTSINRFEDYEGTFYSEIPRSESPSSKNSKKAVGIIKSIGRSPGDEGGHNYDVVFGNDIDQYHITLSSEEGLSSRCLFFSPSLGGNAIEFDEVALGEVVTCYPISVVNNNTLRIRFRNVLSDEQAAVLDEFVTRQSILIVESLSRFYGDSLRDKFLEVQATAFPNASLNRELYSINIDYVESKLNSSR